METGNQWGFALLVFAASCCVASTPEVGREIPKLFLKLLETCRSWGRPAFDSPLPFPAVEMPLGVQPPGEERKGNRKVFSLPFFSPLPLGGLWANSAVSWLGELHVYCTFCTRNACSDHRVPLNYILFSKQLFTLHHCHFLQLELFS